MVDDLLCSNKWVPSKSNGSVDRVYQKKSIVYFMKSNVFDLVHICEVHDLV